MTLDDLNRMSADEAAQHLQTCCVARRWVTSLTDARPFSSVEQLLDTADQLWRQASRSDILEAFEGHPRIGDVATLKKKFAHTAATAGHEQSGMSAADEAVIVEMKALNDAYVERFGYIFIVFASGKSAAEMLSILRSRLNNDPDTEFAVAAAEQGKITRLRLRNLFSETNSEERKG